MLPSVSLSMAYKVLVPPPGMEPGSLAVKAGSLNHWTTREFPMLPSLPVSALQICLQNTTIQMFTQPPKVILSKYLSYSKFQNFNLFRRFFYLSCQVDFIYFSVKFQYFWFTPSQPTSCTRPSSKITGTSAQIDLTTYFFFTTFKKKIHLQIIYRYLHVASLI